MDNNELSKILGTGSQDMAQAMMICKSLHQGLGEVMQKMSDDFVGEGIDVSSVLPSMDEALYFKNFYIQVLKIYGWDPECNDESELLPAVAEREKYYDTYFNSGLTLFDEKEELRLEVEKLKHRLEWEEMKEGICDKQDEEIKKLKEGNEALSSLVKMYKAQIPKKPRKCFSQNDKDLLKQLREGDWNETNDLAIKKLLDRLLK